MIDFLTTLSGIGGLIAFVVFCIFIPWCLSGDDGRENGVAAIAWFIIGLAAVVFLIGEVPDWRAILIGIPVYFAIGVLWFLYRWRGLILRQKAEQREQFAEKLARVREFNARPKPATAVGAMPEREPTWDEFSTRPAASAHKERIAGWIVLWPWGVLWTVLRWPWKLATKIAEWAHGVADRMVDRLWQA